MKKILLIAFLAILSTTPAYAEGRHGGGHGGGGHGGGGHGGGGHYGGGRHYGNYGENFGWWWLCLLYTSIRLSFVVDQSPLRPGPLGMPLSRI